MREVHFKPKSSKCRREVQLGREVYCAVCRCLSFAYKKLKYLFQMFTVVIFIRNSLYWGQMQTTLYLVSKHAKKANKANKI